MATPNIVPRADSEGGLGTASKYWASAYIDLIYVGAGKMGRDADNLIDFSTDNNITFRINNNNELTLDSGQLYPVTNNGLALGAAGYGFSDLYLANGAVIKFDNGNVTLTHSSNTLTLADSDVLALGTSSDLQLFHESGNSFIQNFVGDLTIRNFNDDGDIIFQSDDGSGGVETYFFLDGSSGGGAPFTVFPDDSNLVFGDGHDLRIFHNSANSYIENKVGNLEIKNDADDGDIIFKTDDGSGGTTEYFRVDGGITKTVFVRDTKHEDSKKALFGDQDDLLIYHDSSNSYIDNNTGDFYIRNLADDKDIKFISDNGAGSIATYFFLDGSSATHDGSETTNLYTNWPDKSTISLGTSHDFKIQHNGANTELTNSEGNLVFIQHKDDGDIIFQCDDGSNGVTEYFKLDGGLGYTVAKKQFLLDDNVQLSVGTSEHGINMIHDGSNSTMSNAIGNLTIINYQNDGDISFQSDDGSGGITEYFRLDGGLSSPFTVFPDNSTTVFGNGFDLRLFHNSSHSYISQEGTGNLYIRNMVDDADIVFQSDDGSGGIETYFFLDGSAHTTKFEKDLRIVDNVSLTIGNVNDFILRHNGTNSEIINNTGNLEIRNQQDDGDIIFKSDDGSGGIETYFYLDGGNNNVVFQKDIVFVDNEKALFGTGSDLQIYHNATNSLIDNYGGDLYITQHTNDKDIIFRSDDGSGGTTTYFYLDGSEVSTKILTQKVIMSNLPTSDPGTTGQLWNDNGTLKISAGG